MELFVSTPNGGQQKGRENVKLSEIIPPTATVAATLETAIYAVADFHQNAGANQGPEIVDSGRGPRAYFRI